jgi:hypothetical protein
MDRPSSFLRPPADLPLAGSPQPSSQSLRIFLKTRAHDCCAGIDVPGLGHIHAPGCLAMKRASQLPEPLQSLLGEEQGDVAFVRLTARDFMEMRAIEVRGAECDRLLAQLIFAARDLARQNLLPQCDAPRDLAAAVPIRCRECEMSEHLGELRHGSTCRTGRVLGIIEKLCQSLESNPNEKEAAEGEDVSLAGDGIRPRGLSDLACIKCGARGGLGWTWEPVKGAVDLSLLGTNQLAKRAGVGYQAIYTHDCESAAAASGTDETPVLRSHEGGAR